MLGHQLVQRLNRRIRGYTDILVQHECMQSYKKQPDLLRNKFQCSHDKSSKQTSLLSQRNQIPIYLACFLSHSSKTDVSICICWNLPGVPLFIIPLPHVVLRLDGFILVLGLWIATHTDLLADCKNSHRHMILVKHWLHLLTRLKEIRNEHSYIDERWEWEKCLNRVLHIEIYISLRW